MQYIKIKYIVDYRKITNIFFSNEGQCFFPRGDNHMIIKFENFHLQNHWASFHQTWQRASLGEGDAKFYK